MARDLCCHVLPGNPSIAPYWHDIIGTELQIICVCRRTLTLHLLSSFACRRLLLAELPGQVQEFLGLTPANLP
jgi:hypothetical protein